MQRKPKRFFLHHFLPEGRRKEVKTLSGYSYWTLEQRREIKRMYAEGERVDTACALAVIHASTQGEMMIIHNTKCSLKLKKNIACRLLYRQCLFSCFETVLVLSLCGRTICVLFFYSAVPSAGSRPLRICANCARVKMLPTSSRPFEPTMVPVCTHSAAAARRFCGTSPLS